MLLALPAAADGRADERAALLDRIDRDRLMELLTDLPPSRSPRGGEENQRRLVETEAWLIELLRGMGYEPEVMPIESAQGPTYVGAPRNWNNLIVEIPASVPRPLPLPEPHTDPDPGASAAPAEVLILSAHIDSVPGSPGVDDDGTGVAALLEIARLLRGVPLERTVRLIFFNLEETGLGGSRAYCARVLRDRLDSGAEVVVGMVSLEMLGYFSDEPGSQASPVRVMPDGSPAPTVGDFISIVGLAQHREFSGPWAESMRRAAPEMPVLRADAFPIAIPDLMRSDHAQFLALGVPAVMLTDTANFRNPHYHRASDSIATIDLHRFALVVRGVLGATLDFAGAP